MQKSIIFVSTMLAIAVPGAWAQTAQAGSSQDNQEIKLQIKQDARQVADKLLQSITADSVATAGGTFVFVGGQLFNRNPVKGQPYSGEAVTETTQTLTDGNRIVNRFSSAIYRDSEGRERREESIGKLGTWNAQGEPAKVVFISDPVAKVGYTLHTEDRTAEKIPAPVAFVTKGTAGAAKTMTNFTVSSNVQMSGHMSDLGNTGAEIVAPVTLERRGITASASSTKIETLDPQIIEGVRAEGTRTTSIIPAGQIGNERDITLVSERWYSPELQVVLMTKQSDPRSGDTVYRLTNVTRNEPLHSMFEVPSDYAVSDAASIREDKVKQEKLQIRKEDQQ
jgi:hypothetical protein